VIVNQQGISAIFTSLSTKFNQAFTATESHLDKLATVMPSSSREEDHCWIGNFPVMREWIGDRVVDNQEAFSYTIKNRTFESTFSIKREDIEDDKYGVFGASAIRLAELSKTHPDELIFTLLKNGFEKTCYDGQYFFDADHQVNDLSVSNMQAGNGPAWFLLDTSKLVKPIIFQKRRDYKFVAFNKETDEHVFMRNEYIYGVDARINAGYGLWQFAFGSKAELNADNYAAARASMRSLKADSGRPLLVSPNLLVVSPELEDVARRLLIAQQNSAGASNIYAGTADLIVTGWLA
jgi:phage major head subunit gpT-like protein